MGSWSDSGGFVRWLGKDLRIHDLRHFATLLFMDEIPEAMIAKNDGAQKQGASEVSTPEP
jgi:hypothetical protein